MLQQWAQHNIQDKFPKHVMKVYCQLCFTIKNLFRLNMGLGDHPLEKVPQAKHSIFPFYFLLKNIICMLLCQCNICFALTSYIMMNCEPPFFRATLIWQYLAIQSALNCICMSCEINSPTTFHLQYVITKKANLK